MLLLNVFLGLLFQPNPPTGPMPKVIVGLLNGQQFVIENPEFSGFIKGRDADAVLTYRLEKAHGQMPTNTIARIDFGRYKQGKPFLLIVTLRNGQKVEVQSERYAFVTVSGKTDAGSILIKHPDPVSSPVKLTTKKPNRKRDLTIQYLEFPAA